MANASQGMHSLSTILKRLEAVTSRLEDVATTQNATGGSALRSPTAQTHDVVAGHVGGGGGAGSASSAAPPPPPPPPPAAAPAAAEASSPSVQAYEQDIIDGPAGDFLSKSHAIGGVVDQHASLFTALFSAQRAFLQMASQHAKPAAKDLPQLLQPQAEAIGAIMEAKDKLGRTKEGREWGACLSVLGEGVGAWGWVQVEPAPAPYIGEMKNASQFWADRVTKTFRETKPEVVAWSKSFIAVIEALQAYVKQHHTTGVAWKPNGPPAPASMSAGGSGAAASSGGAPAPPPPPSAGGPPAASGSGSQAAAAGGHAALLASLNRGGSVTSGLKKVDPSQMTHKNPELRTSSVVPDAASDKKVPPPLKAKPASFVAAKKPPKLELEDGSKWLVEYQEDNKNIVIDQTELHQTVHLFDCKNSVVRISGKINAVTMVSCKKTAIVLDSAVSSLSITSSPSFEVQITGSLPTIQIDTTDSGQVYLSKECMEVVEIITSKTSSINISVPTGEQGDFEERPVPEQMKTKVVNGKLVTEIVEHSG